MYQRSHPSDDVRLHRILLDLHKYDEAELQIQNKSERLNSTPIHMAASHGQPITLQWLLEVLKEVHVDTASPSFYTPLSNAALHCHDSECIRILLEFGADPLAHCPTGPAMSRAYAGGGSKTERMKSIRYLWEEVKRRHGTPTIWVLERVFPVYTSEVTLEAAAEHGLPISGESASEFLRHLKIKKPRDATEEEREKATGHLRTRIS